MTETPGREQLTNTGQGMGVVERSREVMAFMALHEALRNVCINSDWTYSVFWTIRPRPRLRGGLGCKAGDEGSLMLMWEDGYCRPAGCCSADGPAESNEALVGMQRVHSSLNLGDDVEEEDPVRKAFRKMSIQLYNYGEGLMGKVASDKCHKWVFRESSETEVGPLNYWQSSFDSHPPEWMDQFSAGIQTIAVIQAGHGLLQLGSCKIVAEDLHFVLRMRYTFESLESQAGGGFLSQTFAPMRNRFFCGSPTGAGAGAASPSAAAVASTAAAWHNGHTAAATGPTYFQSDFRLRLGASNDPAAAITGQHGSDDNNITSLRLSLQNGSPTAPGDRGLNFDFRNGDHDGGLAGQAFPGMKRPAAASSVGVPESMTAAAGGGRSNLLARRMQQSGNKAEGGHSSSFQELLQGGGNYSAVSAAAQSSGVFLPNNVVTAAQHDRLVVQIPPVVTTPCSNSPMVSPMISPNKVQRTGSCMSPMIQAALQEVVDRTSRGPGGNGNGTGNGNCSSPLAVRLSKLTEQPQYSNSTTPKGLNPAAQSFSASHPSTPSSNKDNFPMNNINNGDGCFVVDHSTPSNLTVDSTGDQMKRGDPLHIPAAAWENLKESLEMPRRPPSTSGELYPDFMDSFFE